MIDRSLIDLMHKAVEQEQSKPKIKIFYCSQLDREITCNECFDCFALTHKQLSRPLCKREYARELING